MRFGSVALAVVLDGGDRVVGLAESHQMDVALDEDERDELALLLHEGLTEAGELDLASRVDCGDFLGLHVQDHPV